MTSTVAETTFALRVLDHASSMMAYWDRDLRCCYANNAYQQWFGKTGRELLGTTLPELLGPALYSLNQPYILGALAGRPQQFERSITGPDGIERYSLARYHPDVVDGEVVGFIAEVSDVGMLKTLEASLEEEIAFKRCIVDALRKKDAALEAAQQLGQIGSWHWEIETDITTWSYTLYRLFGYDPTQLPPTFAEHAKLYTPASFALLQTAVDTALSHGTPYILALEYVTPNGSTAWIEARGEVERDSKGAIVGLHGTVQDITRDRRLVEALQAQTHRLELAIDAAHMGMWHWDALNDVLILENEQAGDILGIAHEAPQYMTASTFFDAMWHADCRQAFHEAAERCFEQGESRFYFTGRFHCQKERQLRWLECTGRVIGEQGARRMIGAFFDISERVAIQEALQGTVTRLKESDARKTEFLSTLGHELRNCISPLSSAFQLMHVKIAEAGTERLSSIVTRQFAHISRLVDDIFDLRRLQCNEFKIERWRISFNDVVDSATSMCEDAFRRAGHRLTIDMPQHDIECDGDFTRLTQVLVNLLTNACKYTPPGGVIALSLRPDGPDHLVLEVSDNGIGIAADALERVFDLYVQIHREARPPNAGLGIGLHLVKILVTLHGGTVTAESAGPGKGTTMRVRLPRESGTMRVAPSRLPTP